VLDIDSSVSPTYGAQEGTAYNGHFACTSYHPLFVFNQDGDLERCGLRAGNVHSAHGWRDVRDPLVPRYRGQALRRLLRGDAVFALPDVYEYLEAAGFQYAIRLPANQVLQARIAPLLRRPVGRPPHYVRRFYASFRYRAQSWSRSRRVVAKVEWHPGELYPRVGFIVTNLRRSAKKVVAFYNQRGTAEQWIKEGKHAVKWTRLSCTTFRANAVRLQLHALAYNLANFLRTLVLPAEITQWSLTTLREKVGQDRREGDRPRPRPRLPDGGGGGAARAVRPPPRPDRKPEAAGPGPMLTLAGGNGRGPGGRAAPGVRPRGAVRQAGSRPETTGTPVAGVEALFPPPRRQKILAVEGTRTVSGPGDGNGPRPSGKCRMRQAARRRAPPTLEKGDMRCQRLDDGSPSRCSRSPVLYCPHQPSWLIEPGLPSASTAP
jgi:hypothetical protein